MRISYHMHYINWNLPSKVDNLYPITQYIKYLVECMIGMSSPKIKHHQIGIKHAHIHETYFFELLSSNDNVAYYINHADDTNNIARKCCLANRTSTRTLQNPLLTKVFVVGWPCDQHYFNLLTTLQIFFWPCTNNLIGATWSYVNAVLQYVCHILRTNGRDWHFYTSIEGRISILLLTGHNVA